MQLAEALMPIKAAVKIAKGEGAGKLDEPFWLFNEKGYERITSSLWILNHIKSTGLIPIAVYGSACYKTT
jgi:hypothetical protein